MPRLQGGFKQLRFILASAVLCGILVGILLSNRFVGSSNAAIYRPSIKAVVYIESTDVELEDGQCPFTPDVNDEYLSFWPSFIITDGKDLGYPLGGYDLFGDGRVTNDGRDCYWREDFPVSISPTGTYTLSFTQADNFLDPIDNQFAPHDSGLTEDSAQDPTRESEIYWWFTTSCPGLQVICPRND
jgi:hypothetical protein